MSTLTVRMLFTEYAHGRRDFSGMTITPEDGWQLPQFSDLSSLLLTEATLNGIHFNGADLRRSDFSRASLVGANLEGAVLIEATLSNADLTGADLSGAVCTQANFEGAQIRARLSDANMSYSTLCGVDLTGAKAENVSFRGARMRDAILVDATFSKATFENADLSRADLSGADLSEANLKYADLSDCRADRARFHKALLDGADVEGVSFVDSDLALAHLFKLAWLNSDLTRANLAFARLDGSSFRNCRLMQAQASHAVMSDCVIVSSDLTGIDLTGTQISRSLWQSVTFDHSKLENADLREATFWHSSGRQTTLSRHQIEAATIDQATLTSFSEVTKGPVVSESAEQQGPQLGTMMFKDAPITAMSVVRIFYATDRKPDTGGFGCERDDRLRYGTCDVSIPRDHRMGELEAPSVWRLQFDWDPKHHVTVTAVSERSPARFFAQLRRRTQASTRHEALVFIHGYSVSFEAAVRRSAQLAYDLAFDGPAIAYSWASRADVRLYTYDEATIEDTIPRLTLFLREVARRADVQRLHIIAHSMGNRALVRALQQLSTSTDDPVLVNHVILTAPDIDAGVFKGIAAQMCAAAKQVTMYASSNDLAIQLSKKFHGYRRAGEGGHQVTVVNEVSTIDASELETDLLGHSYFAEHRSVVSDIYYLLQDRPPQNRFGLVQVQQGKREYWKFRSEAQQSLFARFVAWWRRRAKIHELLRPNV